MWKHPQGILSARLFHPMNSVCSLGFCIRVLAHRSQESLSELDRILRGSTLLLRIRRILFFDVCQSSAGRGYAIHLREQHGLLRGQRFPGPHLVPVPVCAWTVAVAHRAKITEALVRTILKNGAVIPSDFSDRDVRPPVDSRT